MNAASVALSVSFVITIGVTAVYLNLRRRFRRYRSLERGLKHGWGVFPVRPVHEIFPVFERSALGPHASTGVVHIANDHTPGGVSDYESWILCNLVKTCRNVFEFGTATGKTAYLLAANSPPDASVTTLTLSPEDRASYVHASGDDRSDHRSAIDESAFDRFLYTGTDQEHKITQLFGDSKTLDVSDYRGRMDLIFIDGSHARSYVASDSRKALEMLCPGGTIVWHDYRGPAVTTGVFEALNALADELPLVQITGTSMIVYQQA